MPDHAYAPVAYCARCSDCFCDCGVNSVELVVTRYLFDDRTPAIVLEHDEMADQVEEPTFLDHAAQQQFQLRHRSGCERLAFNCAPRHETFFIGSDCADACF